jgi:hypothetical protein
MSYPLLIAMLFAPVQQRGGPVPRTTPELESRIRNVLERIVVAYLAWWGVLGWRTCA